MFFYSFILNDMREVCTHPIVNIDVRMHALTILRIMFLFL